MEKIMGTVEIIKNPGIDTLVSGYSPGKVEEETAIITEGSAALSEAVDHYTSWGKPSLASASIKKLWPKIKVRTILKPEEIAAFLRISEIHEDTHSNVTSVFISKLVQNSFDAGYNDFRLSGELQYFSDLPYKFKGREDKLLKVVMDDGAPYKCGNRAEYIEVYAQHHCSSNLGSYSKHSKYHVAGDIIGRGLGAYAQNSEFIVQGNGGSHVGQGAKESKFTIKKSVKHNLGQNSVYSEYTVTNCTRFFGCLAQYCTFTIRGNIHKSSIGNIGRGAVGCTFKAEVKSTLEELKNVPPGNRIVFIDKGKEEVVRDYGS